MRPDELPDPEGEPMEEQRDVLGTVIWISFAAVVAITMLGLPGFRPGRAKGASRSGRIQWEQRQAEIDREISTHNNKADQTEPETH